MTHTITLPPLASYQKAAIFCDERVSVIEATTKAGKTAGCIFWLFEGAMNEGAPGREFWWVAPIYDQTRIAYRRMKRMLKETDPTGSIFTTNDTDPSITLKNGAVMRFKSADKPDGLFGEDTYRLVIDEASRMKQDAWFAARSTTTAVSGKIRIIGNVKGRKNWAYQLARQAESGDLPGWKYAKITCHDAVKAGIITAEQVEQARAELPDHAFKELYEAIPSEDGGNPFGIQHIAACVGDMSHEPAKVFGVDLAKSVDWTVVVGLDANMRVCVFERWQHEPWDRTSERIVGIVGSKPTLVDSTGVGDPVVETMQRKAGNIEGFKFTNQSKQQIMEGLALRIQGHSIGFPDGIMRNELDAFEYDTERGRVFYSAPEGFHDDAVCALALAVEKARGHVPVTAGIVSMGGNPPEPTMGPEQEIHAVFADKRKDLAWGWESNGNGRVGASERYRR